MSDDRGSPDGGPLARFFEAESGPLLFAREVLSSALAVALVGLLLFAVAGVWPPMVAVESESMEPNMHPGDLVFMTEPDRFSPSYAVGDTGVVSAEIGQAQEYRTFNGYGSVIIYQTPDRARAGQSPIIHRAHLYVEEGENWYDRANPEYVNGDSCRAIAYCPAPHNGFITKGDNNAEYDQANDIAPPVRTGWIQGIARVRVPYLGWVRLIFSGVATTTPPVPVETTAAATPPTPSSVDTPVMVSSPIGPSSKTSTADEFSDGTSSIGTTVDESSNSTDRSSNGGAPPPTTTATPASA